MKKFGALLLIGAITMFLVACSSDEETTTDVVATTSPMPTQQPMEVTKTIVDIAVEDGRFETLVAALQAADLVSTLSGEGPFTVFAPTDDAFAALPDGVVAGASRRYSKFDRGSYLPRRIRNSPCRDSSRVDFSSYASR